MKEERVSALGDEEDQRGGTINGLIDGDQARASVFAGREHQSRVICEGEDSPETRTIKNLKENPAGHRNSGASTKWKTAKRLVPKSLNTDEFERWLWRQGRQDSVGEGV